MSEHLEKMHSPSVVELLLLLSDLAIDLLPHLAKLQLSSQNLVLLSLKGSLGFLKSSLQLLLLALHAPPLFVELMDGTATVAELIKQVLDLVGKVLVLTADNVQLLVGLLQRRLQAEPFSVEVPAL